MRFKKQFVPTITAKRATAFCLAGLLLGAGIVALCVLPRPQPLLSAARRLNWNANDVEGGGVGYGWLSDTDLLALRSRAPAKQDEYPLKYAVRWSLLTGTETRLPTLSRVINPDEGDGPQLQNISPDGRRVLWADPASATSHFYTAFVDGHGLADVRKTMSQADAPGAWEHVLWMGDGHTLLQVGNRHSDPTPPYHPFAWLLDMDRPERVRRLPADPGGRLDNSLAAAAVGIDRLRVIRDTSGVPTLEARPEDYISSAAHLEEWRIGERMQRVRQWTISLPRASWSFEAVFSPHADCILWLLDTRQQNAFDALLHDWLPAHAAPAWHRQEMWISRADGSDMRHIGDLPAFGLAPNGKPRLDETEEEAREIHRPQWLPGGAKISFFYNHALYLVDAPASK